MPSQINSEELVVYTAIFDGYDILMEPDGVPDSIDFVCFSDDDSLDSNRWDVRVVDEGFSPSMSNRRMKLLPHQYLSEYKYSVYVDGNIHVVDDIGELVEDYLTDHSFVVPPHPKRDCVYEEAEVCIQSGKAPPKPTRELLSRYSKEGLPQNFGLSENNVILRRHNDEAVVQLMNDWWKEVQSGPGRDQFSLPYVLWKNECEYQKMDFIPRDESQYFVFYPHCGNDSNLFWTPYIRFATSLSSPVERKFARLSGDAVHAYRNGGLSEVGAKIGKILTRNIIQR